MRKILITLALFILLLVSAILICFYLFGRSYVDLSLNGNSIVASFKISKLDVIEVEKLSQESLLGSDWQKGIKVSIDEASAKNLSPYLPKRVYLSLTGKRLTFKTLSLHRLQKPSVNPGEGFSFESDEPSKELSDATSSGALRVSPKITEELWNLSDKLDRIKILLDKELLEGEVVFK